MTLLMLVEPAGLRRLIRKIVSGSADKILESDGSETIPADWRDTKPDFVLVDIDSFHGNGLSAIVNVRSMFPVSRIVAITGYDEPDVQQSVMTAGADACLARDNLLQLTRLIRWPVRKR